MAELTEVDLKLILSATGQDEVESVLKGLKDSVTSLVSSFEDMGKLDPFKSMQANALAFADSLMQASDATKTLADDATNAARAVGDLQTKMRTGFSFNPFAALDGEMTLFIEDVDRGKMSVRELSTSVESLSRIPNPYRMLDESTVTLTQDVDGTWKTVDKLQTAFEDFKVPANIFSTFEAQLNTLDEKLTMTMDELDNMFATLDERTAGMVPGASGGKSTGSTAKSKSKLGILSDYVSGIPNSLMNTAMTGMMGYFAMSSMAMGAQNYEYIQQMMRQGLGMTGGNYGNTAVNQAAQAYLMLSASGLTGSAGVSTLTGIQSNLATMFTRTNAGQLSKQALILEQYGIGPQVAAQSPWQTLQTIQSSYSKLMGQGRATDASQLLSLTGTSQLATAFSNWGALQKSSTTNLGMNSAQLAKAVKSDVSLSGDLAQLGLAFDTFSQSAVPAMKTIAIGFEHLANILSGKNVGKNLAGAATNPFDLLLAGWAGAKGVKGGLSLANLVKQMFKGGSGEAITIDAAGSTITAMGALTIAAAAGVTADLLNKYANKNFTNVTMFDIYKWWIKSGSKEWAQVEGDFSKAVGSLWGKAATDWKHTEMGFDTAIHNLWTNSKAAWKNVQTGFDNSIHGMWVNAKVDWKNVTTGFGSSVKGLWGDVKDDWNYFASSLSKWIQGLADDIVGGAFSLTGGAESSLHSVPGVGKFFNSGFDSRLEGNLLSQLHMNHAHAVGTYNNTTHRMIVTVTGGTKSEDQLAQKIAQNLVTQMKIQNNFDVSY